MNHKETLGPLAPAIWAGIGRRMEVGTEARPALDHIDADSGALLRASKHILSPELDGISTFLHDSMFSASDMASREPIVQARVSPRSCPLIFDGHLDDDHAASIRRLDA